MDLNAADKSFERTVLKTKFIEPPKTCPRTDVFASSFMIDVGDYNLGRVLAVVAGVTSSNYALRRTAEESELLITDDLQRS